MMNRIISRFLPISLKWNALRKTSPVSEHYGHERGTPVDRYFIEKFLKLHSEDIRGNVLEVNDSRYTKKFGADRVVQSDIVDINPLNKQATIIADLSKAQNISSNSFDSIILTQTIQYVFDLRFAIAHIYRILKPGGKLLASMPSVSRIDASLSEIDYWRFTESSARRLFAEYFSDEKLEVISYGNVLVNFYFLTGLAHEEIPLEELEYMDPNFPLIICVRAVK